MILRSCYIGRMKIYLHFMPKCFRDFVRKTTGKIHCANHFPTQRIVILEYQTFNLLAVQMGGGYGKPMGIECKALRTIYFVS